MDRRAFVGSVASGVLAVPLGAFAQRQGKVWRVGMLETISRAENAANLDAFRQGMRVNKVLDGIDVALKPRKARSAKEVE
jgi:putative ABC transport system substrate-binding protein